MAKQELNISQVLSLVELSIKSPSTHRNTIYENKKQILDLLEEAIESTKETLKSDYADPSDKVLLSKYNYAKMMVNQVNTKLDTPSVKIDPKKLASSANISTTPVVKKVSTSSSPVSKSITPTPKDVVISTSPSAPVKKEAEKVVKKVSTSSSPPTRTKRTPDQIQTEKMERLSVQRLHEDNKRIALKELERHHKQLEKIESLKLKKKDDEFSLRAMEDASSTARHESGDKTKRYVSSQAKKRAQIVASATETKVKGSRYSDRQKTIRAKTSLEKAELSLLKKKLSNVMKERDIEERKRRDLDREKRRKQQESKAKKDKLNNAIYSSLKENSPALAYAFKAGSMIMPKSNGMMESGIGSFLGTGAASLGGKMFGGIGKLGKAGFGKVKGMASPMMDKVSNRMLSAKVSSKASIMSKVPKGFGGVASKVPLIGSLIAAGIDFSETKSASSALSVGSGSMAGVAMGAAAGALLGPAGAIIGGIIGGYLGASGAKSLHDKVMKMFGLDSDTDSDKKSNYSFMKAPRLDENYDGSFTKNIRSTWGGDSSSGMSSPSSSVSAVSKSSVTGKESTSGVYNSNSFMSALEKEGVGGDEAYFLRSIFGQESGFGRKTTTSNAGAVGGMQITKGAFSEVADKGWDIHNPEHNMRAGIRYARKMYKKAGGDPAIAAAGYYGGVGGLNDAKRGVARYDKRNPKAPSTLRYGQEVKERIETLKRNDNSLSNANKTLESKQKEIRKAPANVAVVNNSSGGGSVTNNQTIINAPDTDPTIRHLSNHSLYPSRI